MLILPLNLFNLFSQIIANSLFLMWKRFYRFSKEYFPLINLTGFEALLSFCEYYL